MINTLNSTVWATLAPSKIHGIGVHALRDIPKGQRLYLTGSNGRWYIAKSFEGLLPEIKELIRQRWPLAFDGHPFQGPNDDARLTSFVNHGDIEVFNYDFHTDCAFKNIKKGEEILQNYRDTPNYDILFPWLVELKK